MWRASIFLLASWCLFSQGTEPGSPLDPVNRQLPKWVRLTGELRAREEGFLGDRFTEGQDDLYLFQRVRLGVSVKPLKQLEMFVQGQDARVSFQGRIPAAPPYQDSADLRQAWIQIGTGSERHGITLRTGRQELAFGEERLVGASNWGNVSRTFDAVKLGVRHGGYAADVFASSVVAARDHAFDRHNDGDNLHGIYGSIHGWVPRAVLEPFVFWRLSPAGLDSKTVGLRWAGQLPHGLEYTTEMATQRGTRSAEDVRAWAGFWRIGRTFTNLQGKPGIRAEINHASGDADPSDRRYGTFDVLYPTAHDKYGLTDQVGWRNINHIGLIAELRPRKTLVLQFKAHESWLVSARDGLYGAGGALIVRDPSGNSGKYVGEELDAQMIWTPRAGVQIGAGLGHLFPGEFLQHTTPGHGYTFPWIGLTYGF